MWARVAGDVLDLATLALARPRSSRETAGLTAAATAVAGVLPIDLLVAAALSRD
jgi:hypothetical protein